MSKQTKKIRSKKNKTKTKTKTHKKTIVFIVFILPYLRSVNSTKKRGGANEETYKNINSINKSDIKKDIDSIDLETITDPKLKSIIERLQKSESYNCFNSFPGFLDNLIGILQKLKNPRELFEYFSDKLNRQESSEIVIKIYKSLFENPNRHDLLNTKVFVDKDSNVFTSINDVEEYIKRIKNTYDKKDTTEKPLFEKKIKIDRNPILNKTEISDDGGKTNNFSDNGVENNKSFIGFA
jgi:hypothetical protein